jgi:hypothetical protein
MRAPSSILIAVAFLAASASTVVAQTPPHLETGARVRLVAPAIPAGEQIVRIEGTTNDTLVFRSERYPVTRSLALSEISSVDVSLGQRRRTARGAIMGLGTGVVVGAVVGYMTFEPCEGFCMFEPTTASGNAAWVGLGGGLLGLVAGTTIGFLTKSERWQRVHTRTSVGVSPAGGGGVVAVSHKF